eukprot:1507748-Prymnesium_polylepis.1
MINGSYLINDGLDTFTNHEATCLNNRHTAYTCEPAGPPQSHRIRYGRRARICERMWLAPWAPCVCVCVCVCVPGHRLRASPPTSFRHVRRQPGCHPFGLGLSSRGEAAAAAAAAT